MGCRSTKMLEELSSCISRAARTSRATEKRHKTVPWLTLSLIGECYLGHATFPFVNSDSCGSIHMLETFKKFVPPYASI